MSKYIGRAQGVVANQAYGKTEADQRFEPIGTAYTKAESDARYMDINEETLPSQEGNASKYLTTNGSVASWAEITDPTAAAVSSQDNTATDYFDLPSGSTAQRPSTAAEGNIRYNSELGRAEVYDLTGWTPIALPPSASSVSPTSFDGDSGSSFTVTGDGFVSGAVVQFVTNNGTVVNAATTTYNSATSLTATTPRAFTVAEEPLSVRVENPDGLISTQLSGVIDCGGIPTWTTASGQLAAVVQNQAVSTSIAATDPDGQTLTYSYTGNLPSGVSLNTSTGAITGTAGSVSGDTTYSFTASATDTASNIASRAFSILVRQYNPEQLIYNYNQNTGHAADSFSGWSWYHQAASSNGTAFQTNDYIQAECNGLGSTYAGITTALYTSSPISIPSDHNRLEFYWYLLAKDSNGNDGGGEFDLGLTTTPSSQTYRGSWSNSAVRYDAGNGQIGNIDGSFFTSTINISSVAGTSNYHVMMAGAGGQNANIDWRLYKVRTYRA